MSAAFGVERVKLTVAAAARIYFAILYGRRVRYPATPGKHFPDPLTGFDIQKIEMRIATADVDDSIHHGGRRRDAFLIMNYVVFARFVPPLFLTCHCIESVEGAIEAPDEQRAIGDRRRGVHHVASLEFPFHETGRNVQRINISVAAAEVNAAVRDRG